MGSIPPWSSFDTSGDIRQRPFRARLRHQMPGRRALQPEVSMDENPLEKNGLNWKIMGKQWKIWEIQRNIHYKRRFEWENHLYIYDDF
jgi:hypothetical protein